MIEMTVESIRVSMISSQRVVILKEKTAARYLPIWIGPAEADAIAVKLQNMVVPRPLTHDLLQSMIATLGASVDFIVVNELRDDTFYARIVLSVGSSQKVVDSRPSDAIALAVRVRAPIFVEEAVLEKAGILLDQDTARPASEVKTSGPAETKGKVDEEELKRMSAFKEFIDTLDLQDFDKRKS
jgi:bifunctional DNase/RNase